MQWLFVNVHSVNQNGQQSPSNTNNERTNGPVAIQSSPQAKRMKRPVQGRPVSIIAKLAHIVAGLDRMSPAVEAGTTTQSKPTTNTIFAFSEWVAVNDDDAAWAFANDRTAFRFVHFYRRGCKMAYHLNQHIRSTTSTTTTIPIDQKKGNWSACEHFIWIRSDGDKTRKTVDKWPFPPIKST